MDSLKEQERSSFRRRGSFNNNLHRIEEEREMESISPNFFGKNMKWPQAVFF
jgi:hypothetical protein